MGWGTVAGEHFVALNPSLGSNGNPGTAANPVQGVIKSWGGGGPYDPTAPQNPSGVAKGDYVRNGTNDGTITIGTNAFSSATAAFTQADVGKWIWVNAAGGPSIALLAQITTVTDGTHVVLSKTAAATAGGNQAWSIGTDNSASFQAVHDAAVGKGIWGNPDGVYQTLSRVLMKVQTRVWGTYRGGYGSGKGTTIVGRLASPVTLAVTPLQNDTTLTFNGDPSLGGLRAGDGINLAGTTPELVQVDAAYVSGSSVPLLKAVALTGHTATATPSNNLLEYASPSGGGPQWDGGGPVAAGSFEGLDLANCAVGLYAPNGAVEVYLNNVVFESCYHAGFAGRSFFQQVRANVMECNTGSLGYYFTGAGRDGGTIILHDKNAFYSTVVNGGTTGWWINLGVGYGANGLTLVDPITQRCTQYGMRFAGQLRVCTLVNLVTESNGWLGGAGAVATVTGTVAAASTALTVSSGTNYNNGDTITIAGAGTNGTDHVTTIASGGGTVNIVLTVAAVRAVTNASVSKYTYSDVFLEGTGTNPAGVTFDGMTALSLFSSGTVYQVDCSGAFGVTFMNAQGSGTRPVYDPNANVTMLGRSGASLSLRTPFQFTAGTSNPPVTYGAENGALVTEATLTGNATIANFPALPPKGRLVIYHLIQDVTGTRTVALGTQFKRSATAFPATTTGGTRGIIVFLSDGTELVEQYLASGIAA